VTGTTAGVNNEEDVEALPDPLQETRPNAAINTREIAASLDMEILSEFPVISLQVQDLGVSKGRTYILHHMG
jgi:hypothetical protein